MSDEPTNDAPLLSIKDLVVGFQMPDGLKEVIHGLDLSVAHGSATALVGESGSGKSVSMRSILGLLPKNARTTGSAVLEFEDGVNLDLLEAREEKMRKVRGHHVGMVFQNAMEAFNPSLPLGNQLAEALEWHGLASREEARRRAIEALGDVGIPKPELRAKMYPFQLSGGMRQRAMIAMATITRPQLVIADEPTTALDVTVQKQILDLLVDLREQGMAMIMITHDLGVARYVCDDAVVLREGDVVERAPITRLLTSPTANYSRMLVASALEVGAEVEEKSAADEDAVPLIRAEHLTKVFASRGGTTVAVDDVSFTLERGRTLSVVGESGSGKSTVARLVLRLIEPTQGTVEVDQQLLGDLNRRELRRKRRGMQMVFQSPYGSLLPLSTVSENIEEPERINKIGTRNERRDHAVELLRLVELDVSYLDLYPRQLSGGEQQRVAIARALALEPKLLVADEPTSALDASVQIQVLDLLSDLQEKLSFSMILITHNLAVAERLAHDIMVMREGRVIEHRPTDELFSDPEDEYTRNLLDAVLPVKAGLEPVV